MRVEQLTTEDREAAVAVLAASFYDYPVMRYVLGDHPDYDRALSAFVGLSCDKRLIHDWPVLGVRSDERLVAIATVTVPPGVLGNGMAEIEQQFADDIGAAAHRRMVRFDKVSNAIEPPGPHHFVGMLGTLPDYQGRGHARELLNHVKRLSVSAGSKGVALTTEDPDNVPIYERLGFEIVAEAEVDELHTWSLRWRNDQRD